MKKWMKSFMERAKRRKDRIQSGVALNAKSFTHFKGERFRAADGGISVSLIRPRCCCCCCCLMFGCVSIVVYRLFGSSQAWHEETNNHPHWHSHPRTMRETSGANPRSARRHVFEVWEEARESRENPRRRKENLLAVRQQCYPPPCHCSLII